MKSMDGFFVQARANLGPQTNTRREREWLTKVRVVSTTQPLLPPKIKPGVFEEVSNALYGNRWLNVDYRNAAGKRSDADVMPLGLAQQGPRLYLVCRFRDFDNERSLAMHRIVSAHASTLTFERPKGFDLRKYDDDGRFGFGEGKRIRLTFRIVRGAGIHLLESPLSADQQVTEIGNQLEISATVVDTAQLEWWLRGFGEKVANVCKETFT
jgi:predicted DNA-binding transcriptional regulator YafY